MKYLTGLILLVLLMPLTGNTQTTSPLYQILSSSSIIERPIEFRELQTEILEKSKEIEPGIQADWFVTKFGDLRYEFLALFNDLKFEIKDSNLILMHNDKPIAEYTLDFNEDNSSFKVFDTLLDDVESDITRKFQNVFNTAVRTNIDSAPLDALIRALVNNLNLNLPSSMDSSDADKLIKAIVKHLMKPVRQQIVIEYERYIEDTGKLVDFLNHIINKNLATIRQELIIASDKAEQKVYDLINNASGVLASANVGLGFSESIVGVSPGYVVSMDYADRLRVGLFVGGNIAGRENAADSVSTGDVNDQHPAIKQNAFLLGLTLKWHLPLSIGKDVEIDLLGSTRKETEESDSDFEFGTGISILLAKDLSVGAVYFGQHSRGLNTKSKLISYIFGISFHKVDPATPSFMIGFSKYLGDDPKISTDLKPVVQVTFNAPITGG